MTDGPTFAWFSAPNCAENDEMAARWLLALCGLAPLPSPEERYPVER